MYPSEALETWHSFDIPQAKFKIGQMVKSDYHTCCGKITGVNDTGVGIEYSVEGCPWLIWEEELEVV